jgi:arylsulfatase A-like enzyme
MILFFTDQQRWDTVGLHGNPLDLTPNLDRAARRGTHLFNSFTPQPLCGPARSCLQTGLYATTTGCFRNGIPLPQETTTLAHHFGGAHYDTAYVGKWHLAGAEPVPNARERGRAEDDLVDCGRGRDTVLTDNTTEDRIGGDCEVVRRG